MLLEDSEYRALQRIARAQGMSISQWVREALKASLRREPSKSIPSKLRAIRKAALYEFPSGAIDRMLEQIESGYQGTGEK